MFVTLSHYGGHFAIYRNIESLYCMLYNVTCQLYSIKKKIKELLHKPTVLTKNMAFLIEYNWHVTLYSIQYNDSIFLYIAK